MNQQLSYYEKRYQKTVSDELDKFGNAKGGCIDVVTGDDVKPWTKVKLQKGWSPPHGLNPPDGVESESGFGSSVGDDDSCVSDGGAHGVSIGLRGNKGVPPRSVADRFCHVEADSGIKISVRFGDKDKGEEEPTGVDKELEKACLEIHIAFSKNGVHKLSTVDFNKEIYRKAYVGVGVASNLSAIISNLEDFWDQSPVFRKWLENRPVLEVTSIGGGPGTDILGVGLFLEKFSLPNFVTGSVLDLCDWSESFQRLLEDADSKWISGNVSCIEFDFFVPLSPTVRKKIQSTHLLTMVSFVSRVVPLRGARKFVQTLKDSLHLLGHDAMLLFVDCAGGGFDGLVRDVAEMSGLIRVARSANIRKPIQTCPELVERLRLSRNCCTNCNPLRYSRVSAALYHKY